MPLQQFTALEKLSGPYAFRFGEVMARFPSDPDGYWFPTGDMDNFSFEPNPTTIKRFSKNARVSVLRTTAATRFEASAKFTLAQFGLFLKAVASLSENVDYTQAAAAAGAEDVLNTKAKIGRYQTAGFNISNVAIATTAQVPVPFVEGTHFIVDDPDGGFITMVALPDGVDEGDAITIKNQKSAILASAGLKKNSLLQKPYIECALLVRELAAEGPQEYIMLPHCRVKPTGGLNWVSDGQDWASMECEADVIDTGIGTGIRVDIPG